MSNSPFNTQSLLFHVFCQTLVVLTGLLGSNLHSSTSRNEIRATEMEAPGMYGFFEDGESLNEMNLVAIRQLVKLNSISAPRSAPFRQNSSEYSIRV